MPPILLKKKKKKSFYDRPGPSQMGGLKEQNPGPYRRRLMAG